MSAGLLTLVWEPVGSSLADSQSIPPSRPTILSILWAGAIDLIGSRMLGALNRRLT